MYLFRYILNTYTRRKEISGKEYFYEMTPYWDKEKKKIRYHSKYLGVQKENGIEKIRTHLPRNIFVYGLLFLPVPVSSHLIEIFPAVDLFLSDVGVQLIPK